MSIESETTNPYVGLRPFEPEDSLYFFGRREQTSELLEQLHRTHFLAVVGSSGCGKSSLIRAGLIPALLGGFLVEERDVWQMAIMKPGDAPLCNLATALCQALDKASTEASIAALHGAIVSDHTQAVVSYLMPQLGAHTNLLLLIDQFEEVFSFRGAEEEEPTLQLSRQQRRDRALRRAEADDFVDLMLELKADTRLPVYTVLTMRTDFLGDCDLFYGLPEAMNQCRYLVPRLTRQQLRQAIEGPALLSASAVAPRLLDRLLNQLGDRADRLPVLQHALMRTWDIWHGEGQAGTIDLQHYDAAGTLQDALSHHADEALHPADLDTTAKIFKCLTDTDPSHRRVRRPARLSELVAVADQPSDVIRAILDRFREGGRNFLVISASVDADDPRVDISHESLIRQWDTLKAWVDEERESRNQFLDLVHRGHGHRRRERALLQEPDLQIALHWRAIAQPTAAWAMRYSTRDDDFDVAMAYLDQSQQAQEKAAQRRRKLRLFLGVAGTALAILLIGLTVHAVTTKAELEATLEELEVTLEENVYTKAELAQRLLPTNITAGLVLAIEATALSQSIFAQVPNKVQVSLLEAVQTVRQGITEKYLLQRSGDTVTAVAFGPDGDIIATGSGNESGKVRLWNDQGRVIGIPPLSGHKGKISALAFSPDGQTLVSGSTDGAVRLWDLQGTSIGSPDVSHDNLVVGVAFSADGQTVMSFDADGKKRLWDREGKPIDTPKTAYQGETTAVALHPDGDAMLSGSVDGTLQLWDRKGELVETLTGHQGAIKTVAFSHDGKTLASGSEDGTVRLWQWQEAALGVFQGHERPVSAVAFSRNGQLIASGDAGGAVRLWDHKGTAVGVFGGHASNITALGFSRDGQTLISGSVDGTVRWWDIEGQLTDERKGPQGALTVVAFSRDGQAIVSGAEDGAVRLWDAQGSLAAPHAQCVGHKGNVTALAFSLNGQTIVSGGADGAIRLCKKALLFTGHEGAVTAVAFSLDDQTIASGGADGTVRLWDREGMSIGKPFIRHKGAVTAVAFSPDGQTVVSGSEDQTLQLWNRQGSPISTPYIGHEEGINAVAFSPDGKTMVSGGVDGTVRLWQRQHTQLSVFAGHDNGNTIVAFSPDDKTLLIAGSDGAIRLWNREGVPISRPFLGHHKEITATAFSPNGKIILSASEDGMTRLLQWQSAEEEETDNPRFVKPQDALKSVSFSANGDTVISQSKDGKVQRWDLQGNPIHAPGATEEAFSAGGPADGAEECTVSAKSRDGHIAVCGRADGSIELRNAEGEPVKFAGHEDRITALSISLDNQKVASGSSDGTIRLWYRDREGKLKDKLKGLPLTGHRDRIASLAFSPDGQMLVSGSSDGKMGLWKIGTEPWLREACHRMRHHEALDQRQNAKRICTDFQD